MKKDEKNHSTGRTICTRSLAASTAASIEQKTTPALRRSNRGTPSTKPITPASATRKSERLAPSPASATRFSARMEKGNTPSPLPRSDKGKNASSLSSKGSDHSCRNAETSSDTKQGMDNKKKKIQESTNQIKKRVPMMSARSYRALYRGKPKKSLVDASSNDEELVVVGCSRHVPAGNDDAHASIPDSPPPTNLESKKLPGCQTSLEKGTDFPLKSVRDTENMVPDAPAMVETGDDSVIDLPSQNSETQKLLVSKTSIDFPLKRKRDTADIVLDSCAIVANGDDQVTSSDGVIPSPSGCKNKNQPETCNTCGKRQKVNSDFESLSICSCIAQPVEESDHVAQETEPATSRDYEKNRQMLHGKSSNPKLSSSMYPEYWVPVQLSDVQLEQYCRTLLSKSLSLSSQSKNDLGALEETLNSVRKTCDHPYVMDASLKQLLTKNLELHKILDVEIEASGKLHLLDAMLTHVKKNGLKAVVFYQETQSPEGILLGNILEDFVGQRFGPKSYEHGIHSSKKNAINIFNKESQCCVLLLETRGRQTIKLLRAEAFILFGSSLNPWQDVKHLEKIKVESYSEKTKIFRLYSVCTVEEKALILARQNRPVENLNRPLTHALLMWGGSYLFDRLDHFHGSETPDSGVAFEQSTMDGVIHEFSSILSSKGGEENEGKLCLLLEAKHAQGTYSSDFTLFGEEYNKLSDEDSPKKFWTKLLGGKNPKWKYPSDTPQRNRKRVQYFEGSDESPKIGDGGNTKKRKKASDDVTDPPVDNDERKASGKDHMGALESPKVIAVQSSCKSTFGTDGTLDGNDAFGYYSMGGHISGIPKDTLAGHDWRKIPCDSQRRLHAVLKPEMAKLGKVFQLSEACTSMVENFLEYVIENHRIYEEPATTLQAFKIALSWIAALLVKQNLCHKESLVRAKSELAFSCSRVEVNYIYSILCCMKSLFLECTQGLQKAMHSSSVGEECMTGKRCSHYSTATKDIENTISYIKKKCKKLMQKLVQEHEEKKTKLLNMYAEKKRKLETRKELEAAVIRIICPRTSTQVDDLKRLDHDFEKRFDEIKSEKSECLKSLEQMHEAAKKKLAEDEACWISRIKNWVEAELKICVPIKSGNKNFCGICSSNTSKNAPDVRTCNDANVEATYADTNCMASREIQVPEAEYTPGTLPSGSTQQVHDLVCSRNDKAMDVSTLSREQPTDSETTKSKSNERASITVPEIHAGCQEEFASANMYSSEYQNCDSMISAAPDEDVSSRLPEISQSFASLAKSTTPECSLNRDEALVTIENNKTSHVVSDDILDQQNEETCSLDKEKPDELVLLMPHPESVVETRGSAKSYQDDQDMCLMSSSRAEKQPAPATNTQGQNIEAAIEPLSAGSETVETTDFAASNQGDQVTCPLPSSPAGNQPVPEANLEDQIIINTSADPYVAGPDAVESGDYAVSDQETMGAQDACSLPSALVETQSDQGANIEGQDITTEAQLPTDGSDAVETGGSPVSDQGAQDASPLPLSSPGNHPDTTDNIEGLTKTTVAEPHTTGSDACEMEIAEPDLQSHTTGSDACEMERAEPYLQPHTTGSDACEMEIAEPDPQPHTTGSDACEMEIAGPDPQVERSTFTNLVNESGVEPSAVVTAPVPSLLSNGMGQSAVQPVPQIPFPVFNDPFLHELEKFRRESENSKKYFEEKKSLLKADFERKLAEVQAEFQRKFNEVESEHNTRTREIETSKNLVIMNKLLANAFLSKCTDKKVSPSAAPMGRIQQLAQRAAQVSALRNYTTRAPALLQLQASSFPAPGPLQPQASAFPLVPRSSGLPLNSTVCPMPQPRQRLVSNTVPTPSASPVTHSVFTASLRSPAPYLNPYRPHSSSPVATATLTSSSPPQALTYSAVLIQQQQQQNLSSGLQGNNDVVCLSDDE